MNQKYDNNMTGVLFRNDNKEDGDRRPEYTGKCEIEGVEDRIAAWVKEGKKGKFFSMRFEEQGERAHKPEEDNSTSEIPF